MAKGQSGGKPLPKLQKAGVQKLIARLDKELDQVKNSNASDLLKQSIKTKVAQLKVNLNVGLMDPTVDLTSWVVMISPLFEELSGQLKQALPAPQPNGAEAVETGACFYEGGCINSTKLQCMDLGGSFESGATCPT